MNAFYSAKNKKIFSPDIKRTDEIDVAKGIGIFLVVFAHVNYTAALNNYIYSFHMPLFFILSGLVFNKNRYSSFFYFLKKRVSSLIIPYIFLNIFSVVLNCAILIYDTGFTSDVTKTFFDGMISMFLSRGSADFYNAPLWFVLCLFAVEILYFFISKLKTPLIIFVCSIAVIFGWILESGYLSFDNKLLPWSLDSALFALGFYAIGNLSVSIVKNLIGRLDSSKFKYLIAFAIIIFCIVSGGFFSELNGKITLGSKILNNGFLTYLTGILGSIMILVFSVLFKKVKFLIWCGKNSFYIMGSHYLIRVMLRYVYKFFDIPYYDKFSLTETIIPFSIVMILSLLFAFFVNLIKKIKKPVVF